MTTTQIRFQEHLETKRHNLATEQETNRDNVARLEEQRRYNTLFTGEQQRHNQATEANQAAANIINAGHYARQDEETHRSNLANEAIKRSQVGLGYAQLDETSRHNREAETYTWFQAYESARHNMAHEQLESSKLSETARHNVATETENNRSNLASEAIRSTANVISARNADTARGQLEVSQRNSGLEARKVAATESSVANQNANRTANTVISAINAGSNLIRSIGGVYNGKQANEIRRNNGSSSEERRARNWLDQLSQSIEESQSQEEDDWTFFKW